MRAFVQVCVFAYFCGCMRSFRECVSGPVCVSACVRVCVHSCS